MIWGSFCIAVIVVWLVRLIVLWVAGQRETPLGPQSHPLPAPDAPLVSVLIAGKDEVANIEECVLSVLTQNYPRFELIVVDDRSTDGTGAILDRLATEYSLKLRVVHIRELPKGWGGKNHAMSRGV